VANEVGWLGTALQRGKLQIRLERSSAASNDGSVSSGRMPREPRRPWMSMLAGTAIALSTGYRECGGSGTVTVMFETRNLTRTFGETTALDSVSLELETGTTTAIIGPSGCGKSTLLNCFNGLIQPDSGEVCFAGQSLTELSEKELVEARRRIGYVIQEGGLFAHLTARENAELVARLCGDDPDRRKSRITELADLVQLPEARLEDYPDQLSGGERQRVGIIRALMREPEALLLDEPMGALDPLTRADLRSDLAAIFEDLGTTVVLVTHDLAEAASLSDTIVVMRDGRVEQEAGYTTLRDNPANTFVAEFIEAQRESSKVLHA